MQKQLRRLKAVIIIGGIVIVLMLLVLIVVGAKVRKSSQPSDGRGDNVDRNETRNDNDTDSDPWIPPRKD